MSFIAIPFKHRGVDRRSFHRAKIFETVSDVCEIYGVKERCLVELYGFRYFVLNKTERKVQNPFQFFFILLIKVSRLLIRCNVCDE